MVNPIAKLHITNISYIFYSAKFKGTHLSKKCVWLSHDNIMIYCIYKFDYNYGKVFLNAVSSCCVMLAGISNWDGS